MPDGDRDGLHRSARTALTFLMSLDYPLLQIVNGEPAMPNASNRVTLVEVLEVTTIHRGVCRGQRGSGRTAGAGGNRRTRRHPVPSRRGLARSGGIADLLRSRTDDGPHPHGLDLGGVPAVLRLGSAARRQGLWPPCPRSGSMDRPVRSCQQAVHRACQLGLFEAAEARKSESRRRTWPCSRASIPRYEDRREIC